MYSGSLWFGGWKQYQKGVGQSSCWASATFSPAEAPARQLLGNMDGNCTASGRVGGCQKGDQKPGEQHKEVAFHSEDYWHEASR